MLNRSLFVAVLGLGRLFFAARLVLTCAPMRL
jgi:hypothetical protein